MAKALSEKSTAAPTAHSANMKILAARTDTSPAGSGRLRVRSTLASISRSMISL